MIKSTICQFVLFHFVRLLLRGDMEAAKKAAEFYGMNLSEEIHEMEKHKVAQQQQQHQQQQRQQQGRVGEYFLLNFNI